MQMEEKAKNVVMRLGNMEEDVRVYRLLLLCEVECDKVDDDLYEQGAEHASDDEMSLSDSDDSSDSDDR
jgi:hypothetical protein